MLRALAIIPAHLDSQRLPRKVLLPIAGRSMLERVYTQVRESGVFQDVVIATDSAEIGQAVEGFGGLYMQTGPHVSGTDRCAEVLENWGDPLDVVVNVQADQPFVTTQMLQVLVQPFRQTPHPALVTLVTPFQTLEEYLSPHVVKVLLTQNHRAMYCTRTPLPFREIPAVLVLDELPVRRHVGLYAFRPDVLQFFTWLHPSPLEQCEKLEQLRLLEADIPITCVEIPTAPLDVNTFDDLLRAQHVATQQEGEVHAADH